MDIIPGALPLPQQVVMIGVVHPLHDKEVAVLSIKSVVKIQLTEDFPGNSWLLGNSFEEMVEQISNIFSSGAN